MRLRSNRYPTGSERNELTQLMDEGDNELFGYSDSIYKLQEMIVSLSNERDDLRRQMHRAKSLLAPIRRLPPEILDQIFQYDAELDLTYNRPDTGPLSVLSVASVSTYWRDTVIRNFSLWNRITLSVFQPAVYHERVSLVQKAIDRCYSSSLFVTLRFDDVDILNSDTLNPAFALLCAQAQRWQSLSVETGSADLETVALKDAIGAMRGKLTSIQRYESNSFDTFQATLFEGSKKLKTICTKYLQPDHQVPWSQITRLQIARTDNIKLTEMLTRLTNLISLEVHCESDEDEDGPPVFQIRHDDTIPDPQIQSSLRSLSILCSSSEASGASAANLITRLALPSLESLTIGSIEPEGYPSTDRIMDRLDLFLNRSSPPLTTLRIHDTMLSTERLLCFLERLPTLKTLSFSEPVRVLSHALKDEFFLRLRALQESPPLCPQLESLQLKMNAVTFEPQSLVDAVQSRWTPDPEAQHDVACLRELDIKVRHAKLPASIGHSVRMFRRMGLVVSAEDMHGDIVSREY